MTAFTILVETDNPRAREILQANLGSQLLGGIDFDETTKRFCDASIYCFEDDIEGSIVYGVELDGAANQEGMEE